MKTGFCFDLLRHLKKHLLFFIFTVIFVIYLSFILLVKEFFGVNTNSDILSNTIVLSVIIYFILLGFYLTNYLYKIFPQKRHWIIIAIKIVFCILLVYLLYKYLIIFHGVFNELSETFSYVWEVILNRLNIQTGTKRQLFNPAVIEVVFSVFALAVFVFVIWNLAIEIEIIRIDFSEKKEYRFEYYFETEVSLGFLYKALP